MEMREREVGKVEEIKGGEIVEVWGNVVKGSTGK